MMWLRFKLSRPQDFGIKIIGIGNLNVGGSGKTPLVTALSARYDNVAIVLRGYGRDSEGLYVVKDKESILEDVSVSGDEAMIYAHKLPHAVVIVSEDRKKGIQRAKEMGCEIVFLDDAYSKHSIKKLDLLIEVKSENNFCLPSGPFRERLWITKEIMILQDNIDFHRKTFLKNQTQKMSLVTAIARPNRLDKFLPDLVEKHYFADHYSFKKEELEEILVKDKVESLLVTYKDFVKIEHFGLPLSLLELELDVDERVFESIDSYGVEP